MTLRTVALVKQVPMGDRPLGADARLARDGAEAEMNPWCRRAVAQAVRLGRCTAVTMGPPAAADVLREAAAWGAERAVHLSDPALAGADCLVTARALADVVRKLGDADVVLVGHSSTDGSTGAVGPMLAEVLGLPFVGPAMEIDVDGRTLRTRLQVEGGTQTVAVRLPAVVAVAERSCQPAKVDPGWWAPADVVERWSAADLKEDVGPSPTAVVGMRHAPRNRRRSRLDGDVAAQVKLAVAALDLDVPRAAPEPVPTSGDRDVLVVGGNRALLGEAATLGRVTCVG
ncbi:MAG TPA: electron transfer flavoprotein subunit beta/FixA family protein, partial [Pseudonocardiaceae bacterium]|nr:electron transfer flavoprotein subunit beta/FixA family protein [Pseudonocardiaceae bacterium]